LNVVGHVSAICKGGGGGHMLASTKGRKINCRYNGGGLRVKNKTAKSTHLWLYCRERDGE